LAISSRFINAPCHVFYLQRMTNARWATSLQHTTRRHQRLACFNCILFFFSSWPAPA
jgi:hypothetical protein